MNTSIPCVSIDNNPLPEKALPYAIVPVTETFDVLAIQSELLARDIEIAKVLIKKRKEMENQKEVLRLLNLQIHSDFEKEESIRINLAKDKIDSEDDVVKEVAKLRNIPIDKTD